MTLGRGSQRFPPPQVVTHFNKRYIECEVITDLSQLDILQEGKWLQHTISFANGKRRTASVSQPRFFFAPNLVAAGPMARVLKLGL